MKKVQECGEEQQTPKKKHEWLENGYEWLKADKERAKLSERKRRKLEKKKRKQRQKRRKRMNARIDKKLSFLAVGLCVVLSLLDVLEIRGKLPWKK